MNKHWIDIAVLEDYLDGKLDAKAMNKVERDALEDPFVAEALAGLSNSPKRSLESMSLLQKQLQERVAEHHHIKKTSVITWQRLSIAATAAVLFVSVGIIFWMKQNNYQDMLAKQPKKVDVSLAPIEFKDSLPKPEIAAIQPGEAELRRKVIDQAIAVSKSKEAIASTAKPGDRAITVAEPLTAGAANDSAAVSGALSVAAAPQARQSLAFSAGNPNTSEGTKTVSGKIIDFKSGEPLANAGIYAGMPPKGVGSADRDGNFSVNVPADATELTFTSIGYENQKMKIIGSILDVALRENKQQLNDAVVRGYQKRSKETATGNTFVVTDKEVQDVPVANVEQLVQGKVAGLNIQNNTGAPGQKGSINIRGLNSISDTNSARPTSGWEKYRTYLIKANRFSSETKPGTAAEYKFSIRNGRPVNIITVKGVSGNYDEEAIRLIKNGPGWKLSDPTHPEVNIVLKF